MGVEGVLVCTLSALSSFGPVVALANLGASLTQVFASADRVLDLLDEQDVYKRQVLWLPVPSRTSATAA